MQVAALVITVLNLYMAFELGSTRSFMIGLGVFMAASSFWRVLGDLNGPSKEPKTTKVDSGVRGSNWPKLVNAGVSGHFTGCRNQVAT